VPLTECIFATEILPKGVGSQGCAAETIVGTYDAQHSTDLIVGWEGVNPF